MMGIDFQTIFFLLLLLIIGLSIAKGIKKVGDGKVQIVERMGKRHNESPRNL